MIFKRKKRERDKRNASFGKFKDNSFNFELIEKYFRTKNNSNTFQILSEKTCNDLDFEELFMFLDRTTSKVGQQYLYNSLRTIPNNSEHFDLNELIIKELSNNIDFRVRIQKQLEKLKKDDVYYISSLFQEEHLKPPKWFFIIRLLSFTSLISLISLSFIPNTIFILLGVFIINIGIHYWNKKNLYQYLGAIPQLLKLRGVAFRMHKEILLQKINPSLPISIKIIDQVRKRMSFFQLEARLQGDFEVLFWAILEFFKALFLIEPLLLFGVLKRLNTKRVEIENVFSFVGRIDTLVSISSLRKGLDEFCIPVIQSENNRIVTSHVYHPLIANCTTNSIEVNEKSILLTGSNMSGKTTFIRTMGINIITGLTINTCFAKSISMPRVQIYSAIRISDDLMNNKSYYFEEVLTIKEMIHKGSQNNHNLFLLDELFKGTNTIERISAGKAVLSELSKNGNIVFVSTHDIELTDLLLDEYELYHFSEIVENNTVDFDYKLKDGKLKNRNAIRILQINNYPDNLIKEALEISRILDDLTVTNKM